MAMVLSRHFDCLVAFPVHNLQKKFSERTFSCLTRLEFQCVGGHRMHLLPNPFRTAEQTAHWIDLSNDLRPLFPSPFVPAFPLRIVSGKHALMIQSAGFRSG